MSADSAVRLGSGEMFDAIAKRYDFLNRVLSLGIDQSWRAKTVSALKTSSGEAPQRVLDLATGTGDLALAVANTYRECFVVGTDPSQGMLGIGREKVREQGLTARVELERGDAQAIEAADNSFDGCCISFGIRNVPDRKKALSEMARVVRKGGRVAILELSEPKRGILGRLAKFWIREAVPRIGALLSGQKEYRYLQTSIAAFPAPDEFAATMTEAGLSVLRVEPLMFGVCVLYVAEVSA